MCTFPKPARVSFCPGPVGGGEAAGEAEKSLKPSGRWHLLGAKGNCANFASWATDSHSPEVWSYPPAAPRSDTSLLCSSSSSYLGGLMRTGLLGACILPHPSIPQHPLLLRPTENSSFTMWNISDCRMALDRALLSTDVSNGAISGTGRSMLTVTRMESLQGYFHSILSK